MNTDFGLARKMEEENGLSKTGAMMGTPSYMAPGQAVGKNHDVNERSDLYLIGAVLYALLIGRSPFAAASAMETSN